MATLRIKRATASRWAELNPILSAGEPGYETDTHILRIGDGSTAFLLLPTYRDTSGYVESLLVSPELDAQLDDLSGVEHVHVPIDVVDLFDETETWLLSELADEESVIHDRVSTVFSGSTPSSPWTGEVVWQKVVWDPSSLDGVSELSTGELLDARIIYINESMRPVPQTLAVSDGWLSVPGTPVTDMSEYPPFEHKGFLQFAVRSDLIPGFLDAWSDVSLLEVWDFIGASEIYDMTYSEFLEMIVDAGLNPEDPRIKNLFLTTLCRVDKLEGLMRFPNHRRYQNFFEMADNPATSGSLRLAVISSPYPHPTYDTPRLQVWQTDPQSGASTQVAQMDAPSLPVSPLEITYNNGLIDVGGYYEETLPLPPFGRAIGLIVWCGHIEAKLVSYEMSYAVPVME